MTRDDGYFRCLLASFLLPREKICQALHGVHAGVLHGPLSDLAQGAKRNAALAGDLSLRESPGPQMLHHEVVDFGRGLHGLKAYSHLWLKAIAAHGFF